MESRCARVRCKVDPILGEAPDQYLLNVQRPATDETDPVDAGCKAVNVQAPQSDAVGRGREVDDNAVRPRYNHVPNFLIAQYGNRLGDSHRAKPAWIEAIDFAEGGGLGDGT